MIKKIMGFTIAAAILTVAVLAGCGTKAAAPNNATSTTAKAQTASDQEQAAAVAKDVVGAFCSFTYKDHSSFDVPGKYMYPDLAKEENANDEKLIAKYDASKAYAVHGPVTAALIDHTGSEYKFTVKTQITVFADPNKKQLDQYDADYNITVDKSSDGKFLVGAVDPIKK